jgi:hypothetical protein
VSAQAALENDDPEKQSDGKQGFAKGGRDRGIQIPDSCELTQKTSHNYDHKGAKQSICEQLLSARLLALQSSVRERCRLRDKFVPGILGLAPAPSI